jgi:hypothetical protein
LKWLHHHNCYSLELTILSSQESNTLGDHLFEVKPDITVRLKVSVPVSQHQPDQAAQVPASIGLLLEGLESRAPLSTEEPALRRV